MNAKIFLFAGIVSSWNVQAKDLETQISNFIKTQFAGRAVEIAVKITTPVSQWPVCESPHFSLPNNTYRWGKTTVSVKCGRERRFIQTDVQITGSYLASARKIKAGSKLSATDIAMKTGRLDLLPPRTLTDSSKAIGAISLRDIPADQPMELTMLRRAWVIKAGQAVQILTQGSGFSVRSTGKAMNNAAEGDNVRVRMNSGHIVNGIASLDGEIHIIL